MKLVREYIDFERGKDIKKTLDIGLFSNPKRLEGRVFRSKVWSGVNSWGKITNSSTYDYIGEGDYIYIESVKGPVQDNLHWFYCLKFKDFEKLKNYDFKNLDPFIDTIQNCDYEYYYMTLGTLKKRFEYVPEELYESLEFERGRDPKTSMGIGLSKKIAMGLKSLSKDPLVGRLFQVYGINDDERGEYSSFPNEVNLYIEISAREIPSKEAMWQIIEENGLDPEYFYDIAEDNQMFHVWRLLINPEYDKNFLEASSIIMNESLEFERGKDPKEIMKIGSARGGEVLFNLIFEEAKKSPRVFVYPQKPTIVGKFDHWKIGPIAEKKEKYFKIVLKEHVSLWARKEVYVILTESGNVWYFDTEFKEYHPIKNIKDFYKYFNKTELTESLEFERGKDPKTSIGVGMESQMEKKFKLWKVFKRCNDLSHISENFEWVSEIQFDDPNPYFNIESYFYYTDEDDNKYPLNYVIQLFEDHIYCKEVIAKNEDEVRTVRGFVNFTEAFNDDEEWQGVFESFDFERKNNPHKSLRIGKYRPEKFKFKDYNGDIREIEVIDNSFKLNDLDVRLEFDKDEDGEETADAYVDGQKSDMAVFKMTPFDYEFKNQGEYADPGYTGYGYPIAKDKEDLERLKDKHSYWYVGSGDYTRTDKNPFIAVAKMILFTY